MPLITFDTPFKGGLSFYTGKGNTSLVPDVFPIAINGRPYMIDTKSGQFGRRFDQRVRDSQDSSTAPGEAAINPQGLWRRGQASWHYGAGQRLADDSEQQDYRFYKSKGINPWVKGQLTLLNDTKVSFSHTGANTDNLYLTLADGELYYCVNQSVYYTTTPFATSPSATAVTGTPAAKIQAMASDGTNVYFTVPGTSTSYGLWKVVASTHTASNVSNGHQFGAIGYVKGRLIVAGAGTDSAKLWTDPSGTNPTAYYTHSNSSWTWVGFAGGQNAIYAAGYAGATSVIYRITLTSAGALDTPVAALELPIGEVVTSISSYLGYVLLGTNRGVRVCTTDSASGLVAGSLIPTSGSVYGFSSVDRYVYFTWSNYDGVSGGLGRLDLSTYTAVNTPAFATDLMYTSVSDVQAVAVYDSKPVFTISGVGVVAQDTANIVASGSIEVGTYRWGIPDRKFAPRFDTRVAPLVGSVEVFTSLDDATYLSIGSHTGSGETEHTYLATETKFIEASYKIVLTRDSGTTGPTLKRWMARAYAAPTRSRFITVPVIVHQWVHVQGKDFACDVEAERDALEDLVLNPRIVTYQERGDTYSVIVEDVEWQPLKSSTHDWLWEGTAVVTMRTITD